MKVLVLSDSHINPAIPNVEDWYKLGRYVVKHKPDCIVHLGDVADLNSLAFYKIQRGLYTTEEELATVNEHLFAFEEVLAAERKKNRHDKKAIYRPKKILCLGNHDVRNNFTGIEDAFADCNWEVHDYLDTVEIDNIFFSHCMMRGTSDIPCTTANELLENWHSNCVVGHSHTREYAESYSLVTGKLFAIKCPMFNRNDIGWAKQTRNKWSRGWTELDTTTHEFTWRGMTCLDEIS